MAKDGRGEKRGGGAQGDGRLVGLEAPTECIGGLKHGLAEGGAGGVDRLARSGAVGSAKRGVMAFPGVEGFAVDAEGWTPLRG